jgi:hypothetical protein
VLLVGSLGEAALLDLGIWRQSFLWEARVTPVELSINSAINPLLNLEAAQRGRSVLFSDEQKLLFEGKRGLLRIPNWIL